MTNLSPLSPWNTFKHIPFHTDSSHRILRRILSPLLEQSNKHRNRQCFHTPYLRRRPSPGIKDHNHQLFTSRRTFRAVRMCAYGNRQHFCTGGRGCNYRWLRSVVQTWSCFARRITCTTSNTVAQRSRPGPRLAPQPCWKNVGVEGSSDGCAMLVVSESPTASLVYQARVYCGC